jgi:hypothetical protein
MASLSAIRDAVKATLEANVTGLRVYDTVPDLINLPALLVLPVETNFNVAMGRGSDTYQIDLFVMTSRTVPRTGQDGLDAFVTGAGAQSIRAAIFANRSLGLTDGTEAFVSGMSRYGGSFAAASIDHIGAALRLVVTTPGTA